MSDNAIQLCVVAILFICLFVRKFIRPAVWFGMGVIAGWFVGRTFTRR